MRPITVVIAHHHKASRTACQLRLQGERGIQIKGEARSGMETIAAVTKLSPRILLLCFSLLAGEKIALLRALRHKSPATKVILLSRQATESQIMEGLCHGAWGYIEEEVVHILLPRAVRQVSRGEAWVPRRIVTRIVAEIARIMDRHSAVTA